MATTQQKPAEKKEKRAKKDNPMRKITIEKLCINICVGESGERLHRAAKVLDALCRQTPVYSKARFTVRSFGIRRNEQIAVHCTLRGPRARDVLDKALKVKEYELVEDNFSEAGNFGFGIKEHIDLGLKYDPTIGIYGMDIYCVLGRKGFRVARRKKKTAKIGHSHRVTREDAMNWFKTEFDGIILKKK
eukprot:TRINITY_DN331_c0_g1_i1.p1 TRINITY_DN331_c0_g1~~TRINITY_DN331_c0_g1_i1.p1  ORF type:complete len:189 (+),score=37.40 TRINITY_DN331_c0_g1_i1:63-629(+)